MLATTSHVDAALSRAVEEEINKKVSHCYFFFVIVRISSRISSLPIDNRLQTATATIDEPNLSSLGSCGEMVLVELPLAVVAFGAVSNVSTFRRCIRLFGQSSPVLLNLIAWLVVCFYFYPKMSASKAQLTRGDALDKNTLRIFRHTDHGASSYGRALDIA